MDIVFLKSDFKLCDVPVPKGYPQSQTHAGVAKAGNLVLLSSSPFPSMAPSKWHSYLQAAIRKLSGGRLWNKGRAESYENPCVYSSKDGIIFSLMQSRPLMESPDAYYGLPAYNSDPDLYVEGDEIYLLNRAIFRTKLTPGKHRDNYDIRIYLIKGILDKGRFKYISTRLIIETTDLIVSPCLVRHRGNYIFTSLWTNCYNDGESFDGLRFLSSESIDGLFEREQWHTVEVDTKRWIPWHMSIFSYQDKLYAIVACVERGKGGHRCWQMLGSFDSDLRQLKIYKTPLTDYKSYRGAAYVDNKGDFYLYSTTVHEKIKGSKAVDGRDIILASMPFMELLKKLEEVEQQ